MNLKDTLNLPKTSFPMKLDKAVEQRIIDNGEHCSYIDFMAKVGDFVLHDGPPFANGDLHIGHAINKVIKDVICRLAAQRRRNVKFRPGWDCHGLPIETAVKAATDNLSVSEFRAACAKFAAGWIEKQRDDFARLGVDASWCDPYLTMDPQYEGSVLRVFGKLLKKGLVVKKNKPVHWSLEHQTALAVGELEYKDVTTDSIYVGFEQYTTWPELRGTQFLAWTTTPWTLPANQALAINKNATYVRVEWNGSKLILAEARVNDVCPGATIMERIPGEELLGMMYVPLFKNWNGGLCETARLFHADFVSVEAGTGIVHVAPAHGADDFALSEAEEIPQYTPVQQGGTYTPSLVPEWLANVHVFKAQQPIIDYLRANGKLHGVKTITHSYPHDWRSGQPTITRATEQWFILLDKPYGDEGLTLRERCVDACDHVEFVPASSKNRFVSMLKSRPDWCISRQRSWGLPIPAFYDDQGRALMTPKSVEAVASNVVLNGSQSWFDMSAAELVDDPLDRPLRKESDTFDVWFESGASFVAMGHGEVADVVVEGTDQHRGWFQHSMLLSVAYRGKPSFKKVVTHGFVVKPDGTKVSKRDKEYVPARKTMDEIGTDPVRWWIVSNDYQQDVCASPDMLRAHVDKYNKLRNTLRYLVSVLNDFSLDHSFDAFVTPREASLHGWILHRIAELKKTCSKHNDDMHYHLTAAAIQSFCNVDLSSVYANAMKDRLYCGCLSERREAQSTMYVLLGHLLELLTPFVPATVAEVRQHYPRLLQDYSDPVSERPEWAVLMDLREKALLSLDSLKKTQGVNKATDAKIIYTMSAESRESLARYGEDLADMVGAGSYEIVTGDVLDAVAVDVRQTYEACQRSWKRRPDVRLRDNGFVLSNRDYEAVTIG